MECRDDEEDEIHEEAELLHTFPADEFNIDQERSKIITTKGDTDINQVPEPTCHDGGVSGGNDWDELRLEEFVSVEEDVVAEPGACCGDETTAEVVASQLERLHIVASNTCLLLGGIELFWGEWHFVESVVNQPKRPNSRKSERNAENPLRWELRVGRVSTAMMEDEG